MLSCPTMGCSMHYVGVCTIHTCEVFPLSINRVTGSHFAWLHSWHSAERYHSIISIMPEQTNTYMSSVDIFIIPIAKACSFPSAITAWIRMDVKEFIKANGSYVVSIRSHGITTWERSPPLTKVGPDSIEITTQLKCFAMGSEEGARDYFPKRLSGYIMSLEYVNISCKLAKYIIYPPPPQEKK